jgi:rod shape-determining protein MreB
MIGIQASRPERADIAIDLGTANTLVVERGSGVVFDEPSICCFGGAVGAETLLAAGREAESFEGRVTKPLRVVRPLRNGVLSDMTAARELLRFATRGQRPAWRWSRVRALIGVPADATQAERKALMTAAVDAGLAQPRLIAEPLLAAMGAGLETDEPRGRMLVDCGAGTTEVAVISLGRICYSHSVRGGGDALDQALVAHFALHHHFHIGSSTAERLKVQLSGLFERGEAHAVVEVRGLDTISGIPRTLTVAARELAPAWDRYVGEVIGTVRIALSEMPPAMAGDILEEGILLAGGGALTGLLAQRIESETGVSTAAVERPLEAVAAGLLKMIG